MLRELADNKYNYLSVSGGTFEYSIHSHFLTIKVQ